MDLLTLAKQERDRIGKELARVNKIIAMLDGGEGQVASKPKPKSSSASKAYWTPQRRAAMSRKIKALQAKKKKAAKAQPPKSQGEK
jgi:hypothetical protein